MDATINTRARALPAWFEVVVTSIRNAHILEPAKVVPILKALSDIWLSSSFKGVKAAPRLDKVDECIPFKYPRAKESFTSFHTRGQEIYAALIIL